MNINEIIAKGFAESRLRQQLERQTPWVLYKEKGWRGTRDRYLMLHLGELCFWKDPKGARNISFVSIVQTFRQGVVRKAPEDLVQEIQEIGEDIERLREIQHLLLKDRFLYLDPIDYEEGFQTRQRIYETLHAQVK